MKTLYGLSLALLLVGAAFAQYRTTPIITGGFGSVVNPAGTAATYPALNRFTTGTGGIVMPNGSPRLFVPGSSFNRRSYHSTPSTGLVYSYPVYVGGYGYGYESPDANAAPAQAPQTNITVIVPPQPGPVVINQFGPGPAVPPMPGPVPPGTAAAPPPSEQSAAPEPTHYLIALKDHTVYAAVAYWVQDDTLHYFTEGNVHNQVSLSLVDQDLTKRLNREGGVTVDLMPAAK